MKKNLLILGMLLAVVAVVTRLNRSDLEPDGWAALRQDEMPCLEALWGQAPQVELRGANEGVRLELRQTFASDVPALRRRWSYDVARLVALRHPQVPLGQIRVLDASTGQEVAIAPAPEERAENDRSELLRRQRQAQADQIQPGTLVLLDIAWAPAPNDQAQLQNRIESAGARRRAPGQEGAPLELEARDSAVPAPPQTNPVSTTCWLVTTSEPSQALLDVLQPVERVVRLPIP